MKVFISHAKHRSLVLAQALAPFIRRVVPGTDPWVSETGIEKGSRFMSEIRENLGAAAAGIVCLTRENLTEPWILYESGALSTKTLDRVWTVLLDVTHTDVPDPLKGLNHTAVEKAEIFKMVQSIHKTLGTGGDKMPSVSDVESYFEAFWPALYTTIADLKAQNPAPVRPPDPQQEILSMLQVLVQRGSAESWRERKILAMLHLVYKQTIGVAAPSLNVLTSMVNSIQEDAATQATEQLIGKDPTSATDLFKAELIKREFRGELLD